MNINELNSQVLKLAYLSYLALKYVQASLFFIFSILKYKQTLIKLSIELASERFVHLQPLSD